MKFKVFCAFSWKSISRVNIKNAFSLSVNTHKIQDGHQVIFKHLNFSLFLLSCSEWDRLEKFLEMWNFPSLFKNKKCWKHLSWFLFLEYSLEILKMYIVSSHTQAETKVLPKNLMSKLSVTVVAEVFKETKIFPV